MTKEEAIEEQKRLNEITAKILDLLDTVRDRQNDLHDFIRTELKRDAHVASLIHDNQSTT